MRVVRGAQVAALAMVLLATSVLGCREKDCSDLSQSACERSSKCTPRVGTELSGGKPRAAFAGCDSASRDCGDAETCAQDYETKRIVFFGYDCLLPGWVPLDNNKTCTAIRDQLRGVEHSPRDSGMTDDAEMDSGTVR